jgi:signal transduction histidine kinase/CheY-like chemotaxis protein
MSQLDALKRLPHGSHVCPIYQHDRERFTTAAAFLGPGFARGERCLYVASEPGIDRLLAELAAQGFDVRAERDRGALHLLSDRDVYLRGGHFSADAMLEYLDRKEREALRDRFSGLRYAGEMSWAVSASCEHDLIPYEIRLNEFLEGRRMVVSCLYNRERFDDAIIHDVLRSHPLVVIGDRDYDNPYYEPPEILMRATPEPPEFRRTRVRWWIERLRIVAEREAEREELVGQLRQAQKLDAMGRLASGVAHDFNNLLTVIVGSAALLEDLVDDEEALALVQDIRRACEHSSALTRQLLSFSRKEVPAPRAIDLNTIVEETLGMLVRLLGQRIRVEKELERAPLIVRVDRGQIQQVLMNLAVNARDAMPDGGTLTLRTRAERVVGDLAERLGLEPGSYATLQVGDTGTGMTDEVRQRLFEPFFTTKGHGRGTGLGLAVVHGIVIQNHGAIHVDSRPGDGSVFTVWLPMVASAVDEPEPQAPPASTDAAGETVLIVEDEEPIRKLIRRVLERAGYRVLEAADAVEGTRQFHARAVDLIIADVGLPDMQGDQLAESLLREAPDTRVLLLSGFTEADIGERVSDLGIVFLPKPFTPQDLLSAVAALLSRGCGRG